MMKAEREALIERYAAGAALLREALAETPVAAMRWRPGPGKWSVHEVVVHCADSETNSALRIRYLTAEDQPAIQGYDQDRWARVFDYDTFPVDLALQQLTAVRAWTTALLRRLPDEAWSREGTHTELPGVAYTATMWLEIYAEHLEIHAAQIRRTVTAWLARKE